MTNKITAWNLNVTWSNGEENIITDMPMHIIDEIESFLDFLEEQESLLNPINVPENYE